MELIDYGAVLDVDIQTLPKRKPASAMGKISLELSSKFRENAIMALLVEDWIEAYCGNLARSGLSRLIFLDNAAGSEADNPYLCSSFFDPLIDAMAGGDMNLATRIAEATPPAPQPCGDPLDFHYSLILHKLLTQAPGADSEALLEGPAANNGGPRLAVSRALVEGDDSAFHTAFEQLLDSEQSARGKYSEWDFPAFEKRFSAFGGLDAVMEVNNGDRSDDESLATLNDLEKQVRRAAKLIFIEGLALLQLAESRGFHTQDSYRYCPVRARRVRNTSFDWAEFASKIPRTQGAR